MPRRLQRWCEAIADPEANEGSSNDGRASWIGYVRCCSLGRVKGSRSGSIQVARSRVSSNRGGLVALGVGRRCVGIGRLLAGILESGMKGPLGETKVAAVAWLGLPSDYSSFLDVTLPARDGTTQVDHVFVSRYGVFVVETKNMAGWIFGTASDRRWTQRFPNGRTWTFPNPLRQNYGHVKAVQALLAPLDVPAAAVRSVVAFVGQAVIKTPVPENVTTSVGLVSYIRSFSRPVLSADQVEAACDVISATRLPPSWSTHCRHVEGLRSRRAMATRTRWGGGRGTARR